MCVQFPFCIYRKIGAIIAPVPSSLINEAVASGSYPNLFKVSRVTPNHKSGSKFDFKNYRAILYYSFLIKSLKEHYTLEFYNFITVIMLFTKINMASSRIHQQLMLYSNSPRSVTQQLIVKKTLLPSFSTSVRRLILFVMTLS